MPAPPPFVVNTDPKRVAESQTALIIGVITAVNFVALTVVAARTYTRLVISKSPGAQDVLMVLSAVRCYCRCRQLPISNGPAFHLTLCVVYWAYWHDHPVPSDPTWSG